jgi:hypothetical protein
MNGYDATLTLTLLQHGTAMGLNKKQKKQIDVAKKKIKNFQQLLVAAKAQPDDPAEAPRIESEIAKQKQLITDIQNEG